MTTTENYLRTFFKEKDLGYKLFEIEHNGDTHIIDNEAVVEIIYAASRPEQEQIAGIIRKIDFMNGNVNHFLEHLAKGYVATNF